MASLITVYWRDIPAQIILKQGRKTSKILLSERFQKAIDRAAMRAGKGSSDAYMEDWKRVTTACEAGDIQQAVQQKAEELEAQFSDEYLEQVTKNKGLHP